MFKYEYRTPTSDQAGVTRTPGVKNCYHIVSWGLGESVNEWMCKCSRERSLLLRWEKSVIKHESVIKRKFSNLVQHATCADMASSKDLAYNRVKTLFARDESCRKMAPEKINKNPAIFRTEMHCAHQDLTLECIYIYVNLRPGRIARGRLCQLKRYFI